MKVTRVSYSRSIHMIDRYGMGVKRVVTIGLDSSPTSDLETAEQVLTKLREKLDEEERRERRLFDLDVRTVGSVTGEPHDGG